MDGEAIRVLLIEDSRSDALLVEKVLAKASGSSITVEWANQLSKGLERLTREKFDALLLDMSLPDSAGLATLTRAYAQSPHVPIVLLTGQDDEALGVQAVHAGAQDYLVKNHLNGNLLTRSIRYAIERHRLLSDAERHIQENVNLSQRLQDSNAEMALVDEVARIITATLNIDEVYDKFAHEVQKLVDFDRCNINFIDYETGCFQVRNLIETGSLGRRLGEVVPLKGTRTEHMIVNRRSMIETDLAAQTLFAADKRNYQAGLRSSLAVPMISNNRVIGTMHLRSRRIAAYGDRERAIVERLANQIAPAVANVQLYEQTLVEKERATTTLAQLRALLDGVDAGIVLVDEERRVLWASRLLGEFFGITDIESIKGSEARTDEMLARMKQCLADPDGADAMKRQVKLDRHFAGPAGEVELVRPAPRILQRFTAPVFDEAREYLGRLWVYYDVTEQRRLEEQLLQTQKMETVGRLAGGVAHDFNNLLTAILGYSHMSLAQSAPNSSLSGYIKEIQGAAERASHLTNQLLAFSRRQIIESRVLNLNDLILDLDGMLRRLIGEDVELVTIPTAHPRPVKVDPAQIEQVLMNLVVNARDAMPRGGKLVIETAPVTLAPQQATRHTGKAPGHYMTLAVSDTGMGMSKDVKQHLFEPFFTTKEVGKGTGLGLATCYGIVQQSGGRIEVYSELGEGTSVKVYIPVSGDTAQPAPMEQAGGEAPRGTETVLLAEDEPLVREMVSRLLRQQGYQLLEAANGSEALQVVDRHPGQIDILVTDVVMPKMGGPELAERMRRAQPGLKVLFTSGYTEGYMDQTDVLALGTEFLPKPYMPNTLATKVREVIDSDVVSRPSS